MESTKEHDKRSDCKTTFRTRCLTVHELLTGLRDQLVDHGHGLRFSLEDTTKSTTSNCLAFMAKVTKSLSLVPQAGKSGHRGFRVMNGMRSSPIPMNSPFLLAPLCFLADPVRNTVAYLICAVKNSGRNLQQSMCFMSYWGPDSSCGASFPTWSRVSWQSLEPL